jgi:hypothetical protein
MAITDESAGLRGEYEILLDGVSYLKVHQTSPTYTFASQQGVSGRDEMLSLTYVYVTTQAMYGTAQLMCTTRHKLRPRHKVCVR